MKMSNARKVAATIGILAASLTGSHANASETSGRLNIQTVPDGVRYLVVASRGLVPVRDGLSPYFDTAFPAGKYKVCFELDGYLTVWEDSFVSTYGSSWIGPVMKPSQGATRTTCEDDLTRMKVERGLIRSSLATTIKKIERAAPPESAETPAAAPSTSISIEVDDHHHDGDYRLDVQRAAENRDKMRAVENLDQQKAAEIRDRVEDRIPAGNR